MEHTSLVPMIRQNLEPLLVEHGFVLTEIEEQPFDVLKYKRAIGGSITFHNDREQALPLGKTRLFVAASSPENGAKKLESIKQLLPTFLSLPVLERGWWTYRNREELLACMAEIGEIIKERLFEWFEYPVSNPANVPFPELTPETVKALLKSRQHSAELARNEGRIEDLERLEQSIERMKKILDDMLNPRENSAT